MDLTSILSRPAEEIKAPPPKPVGSYLFLVQSYEFSKNQKTGNDFCRVKFKAIEAKDDVDQTQLAEAGGLEKIEMSRDFYITEDSAHIFVEGFLTEALCIPASGRTAMEMVPEMVGKTVIGVVTQSPVMDTTKNPPQPTGRMRSEIRSFAAAS